MDRNLCSPFTLSFWGSHKKKFREKAITTMNNNFQVIKSTGEREKFSTEKLRNSLKRSGASEMEIAHILETLMPLMFEGISTKKIYVEAFRLLRHHSRAKAARYYLKRGIMDLGPSGFPFEKFIAELFKRQGYGVKTGLILNGKCVTHEIDVMAEKEHELLLIECKYRNESNVAVDVKTPLYIHSRFEDVMMNIAPSTKKFTGWIVTNSRFTGDAQQFSFCKNIKLLSWSYPKNEGLKDIIDNTSMYPVTCLTSLTKHEKQMLLDNDVVLVKDIVNYKELLQRTGIKPLRLAKIIEEANLLCR
jgi:Holliday junction resolvase